MTDARPWLSVVSPVYRAEDCLEELCRRVLAAGEAVAGERELEVVLVEDSSPDRSWAKILEISSKDKRVRGVRLSRNFGQHRALTAGITEARGERIVVMDCDLQDPPEEIPKLMQALDEGADVVLTRRVRRGESALRVALSRAFFWALNRLSPHFVPDQVGTLSAMRAKVARQFLEVVDHRSYYLTVLGWLGFRTEIVDVQQGERFAGKSSYSLRKALRLAVDAAASQSTVLLQASTTLGLLFWLISISQIVSIVYRKLVNNAILPGWSSLMVVLWFVGGSVLLSLGILGLYLGQVLESARDRPLFVVASRTTEEE
ncbi:MAG: glycosyltransferase [Acidobacteriota bacterium]